MHRYRLFGRPTGDDEWTVDEAEEVHHLRHVLRLEAGASVEITDGEGQVGLGLLNSVSSRSANVSVTELAVEKRPQPAIELGLGALKPGHVDDLLPSLIELGLDVLHVFYQSNTAKSRINEKARDRWRRISIVAIKQCKRAWIPDILVHDSLESLIKSRESHVGARLFLTAEAPGDLLGVTLPPGPRLAVAGGERGLNIDEELLLRDHGFTGVTLGPHILRATTATSVATAILGLRRHSGRD